jgi:capsular polysaccharide export protein
VAFLTKLPEKPFNQKASPSRMVLWGARDDQQLTDFIRRHDFAVERVEDGFIRSVGLGSDLIKPASLIVDRQGIYFDPRQSSDLEWLLNTIDLDDAALSRAHRLRKLIVSNGISKYNTGRCGWHAERRAGRTVILVPGQVEDDASIRTGGVDIKSNHDLLKAVRQANPNAHIIFKPHPDVLAGNRVGQVAEAAARALCDEIVTDCDINACLDQVDEVHTMTSLTGFEALLREKIVHTYGLPFYAGWGLTIDRHSIERRCRQRSVDELLYCALVLYPRYYHWGARMFVCVEDALDALMRIKSGRSPAITVPFWWRLAHKAYHLYENCGLRFKG